MKKPPRKFSEPAFLFFAIMGLAYVACLVSGVMGFIDVYYHWHE